MAQILEIRDIAHVMNLPCIICHEKPSVAWVSIRDEALTVNAHVCSKCQELTPEKILYLLGYAKAS